MPYEIIDSEDGEQIPIAEVTFADGTVTIDSDDDELTGYVDRVNDIKPQRADGPISEQRENGTQFEARVEHTEETAINRLHSILSRNGYGLREVSPE